MYAKETITTMANRIMLNETSYHGAGAIQAVSYTHLTLPTKA